MKLILSGAANWCLEAIFLNVKGVDKVESGNYDISSYDFAFTINDKLEVVQLTFDENKITLQNILDIFYITHNPTINSWNKDECFYPACRSVIFLDDEKNKDIIIERINLEQKNYDNQIYTKVDIIKNNKFKITEEKYQNYYEKNPKDGFCTSIIEPKMERLKNEYRQFAKKK